MDAQSLSEVLNRLGRLALGTEGHAPVVVGIGAAGMDAQSLPEVLDRLDGPTLGNERRTPVCVGLGIVGFKAYSVLEMVHRLGQLTLTIDGPIGVHERGRGMYNLGDVLSRPCHLALVSEREAQVGVGLRKVRPDAQSPLEVFDRLDELALQSELISEVLLSDGRVGVD